MPSKRSRLTSIPPRTKPSHPITGLAESTKEALDWDRTASWHPELKCRRVEGGSGGGGDGADGGEGGRGGDVVHWPHVARHHVITAGLLHEDTATCEHPTEPPLAGIRPALSAQAGGGGRGGGGGRAPKQRPQDPGHHDETCELVHSAVCNAACQHIRASILPGTGPALSAHGGSGIGGEGTGRGGGGDGSGAGGEGGAASTMSLPLRGCTSNELYA